MQISRHWRLNANRYRLEGFVLADGEMSIEARETVSTVEADTHEHDNSRAELELPAAERTAA